jgi:ABC-2 type transport system permease protein
VSQADLAAQPSRLGWAFRKYFNIFRVSLIERMTYRGDFLLATFLRFLPMITTILLWQAIYRGTDDTSLGSNKITFTLNQMISYLLLVHISRMFSSMPGLAGGIAREIRDGSLRKYLLQPLDMTGYLLSYRVAHKVSYIMASAFPYAVLFFFCRGYFTSPSPDALTWAAYALSLVLGFVIGFFFEVCMGLAGFWILEVTSLLYIVQTVNFFVSGHMFPVDLLPAPWPVILKALPFSYLAYFPATVILGKVQGADLVQGLAVELAWAVGLVLLARWMYRRGLKRYSAFGG